MTLPTPLNTVPQTDSFDQWRQKTNSAVEQINQTVEDVGDIANLQGGETSVVDSVNNARNLSIAFSIALG